MDAANMFIGLGSLFFANARFGAVVLRRLGLFRESDGTHGRITKDVWALFESSPTPRIRHRTIIPLLRHRLLGDGKRSSKLCIKSEAESFFQLSLGYVHRDSKSSFTVAVNHRLSFSVNHP